eukprot:scaffold1272_cov250-Pinguiococcus_pyrenoidosus.AAC.81
MCRGAENTALDPSRTDERHRENEHHSRPNLQSGRVVLVELHDAPPLASAACLCSAPVGKGRKAVRDQTRVQAL